MEKIRFFVVIPILIGAGAGAIALFDPKTVTVWALIIGAAALILQAMRRRISERPKKKIKRVRVKGAQATGDGFGSVLVEADHSSKVSALSLPLGSRIKSIDRNALYLVSFPIPAGRNPTSYVYEVARALGYKAEAK